MYWQTKNLCGLAGGILLLGGGCAHRGRVTPLETHGTSVALAVGSIQLHMVKEVLKNGLTVVLVENRKLPLFSFHTFVKVGSRHESSGMTGASHYLEHLMFKGSRKYAAGEFERIIIGNGGSHNAYTSRDLTVYHESLPINALDNILDLEADRLFHLSLEKESFEKERSVILEERKYRTENNPRGGLFLATMAVALHGTPYAHPPIGSVDDIKGVSQEQITQHFETYYDPANIVIVLSGDFNAQGLMAKMRAKFGQAPSRGKWQQLAPALEGEERYRIQGSWRRWRSVNIHGKSPVPLFMAAYPSFSKGHQRTPSLDILGSILGSGQSSYLVQKLVHGSKPILAGLNSFNYSMHKSGLLLFSGQLLKGQSLPAFQSRLRRELKGICQRAVSERAVEKVKNQYLAGYFAAFETNSGLAELVGQQEVTYGDPYYFKQELEKYLGVSSAEVMTVCQEVVEGKAPLFVSVWDRHRKKGGP